MQEPVKIAKLRALLAEGQYKYELIHHDRPIRSALDGVEYFGIEVGQTAPTLILNTNQGYLVLIISGERGHVDFQEIARLLNCTEVKLASPREVLQVTGCSVGSVSMAQFPLPCIIDEKLSQYDFVYGGSGEPDWTLKLEPGALKYLNNVVAVLS